MKKITHLSPTGIALFEKSQQDFYIRYLADWSPGREAQTAPMAVGSSFDAYVKSFLHTKVIGEGKDPRFELKALFEAQVEEHNRAEAWEVGRIVFEKYKECGALSDLLIELQQAVNTPKFEIEVKGVVNGQREGISETIGGVVFLGKPDLYYLNKVGTNIKLDWKVNGYYSNYPPSPMKGYVRIRDGRNITHPHKDTYVMSVNGTMINVSHYLNDINEDWARQLAIYGWLCGERVGEDSIVAIDQIVCNAKEKTIRVAEHRLRISGEWQKQLFDRCCYIWEICNSDHFFRDVDKSISQARCAELDKAPQTQEDAWFRNACR